MRDSCPWRPFPGFSFPRIFAIMMIAAVLASASTGRAIAQAPPPPSLRPVPYTPDSIFMALFANGDALVEYDVMLANSATNNTAAADAGKVKVRLFGTNISELIVTDLDDKIIPFNITTPGEIEMAPGKAAGARISYLTPDLVNKVGRTWTFTLEAPMEVAVKMPADSISVDYGNNVPALSQIGSQTLLTFKAGSIRFSYIVGTLGTEDQADLTTKFADAAIKQAKSSYQGIVLTEEEALLANATAAKTTGRFTDAIKMATQVSDQVQRTVSDYTGAQSEISRAGAQISQAASQGRDTTRAAAFLDQARGEFSQGKYPQARSTVAQAVASIADMAPPQFPPALLFAVTGIVVAGGGAGAYMFFFKKKRAGGRRQAPATTILRDEEPPTDSPSLPPDAQQPSLDPQLQHQQQAGEEDEQEPLTEEETDSAPAASIGALPAESARALAGIPESQTDKGLLGKIVSRIIEERPHLRPEDRDVLGFLAEKEGAAFESEVRSRFSLPKTTVWRLVKRLEREELVEIRKAGGQNLIKLRFEGRQA